MNTPEYNNLFANNLSSPASVLSIHDKSDQEEDIIKRLLTNVNMYPAFFVRPSNYLYPSLTVPRGTVQLRSMLNRETTD